MYHVKVCQELVLSEKMENALDGGGYVKKLNDAVFNREEALNGRILLLIWMAYRNQEQLLRNQKLEGALVGWR